MLAYCGFGAAFTLGMLLAACSGATQKDLPRMVEQGSQSSVCRCDKELGQFSGHYGYFTLKGVPEIVQSPGGAGLILRVFRGDDSQAIRWLRERLRSGTGDVLVPIGKVIERGSVNVPADNQTTQEALEAAQQRKAIRLLAVAPRCPRADIGIRKELICSVATIPTLPEDGWPISTFYSEGTLSGGGGSLSFHVISWENDHGQRRVFDSEWSTIITRNDGEQLGLRCRDGFRLQECTVPLGDANVLPSPGECAAAIGDAKITSLRIKCVDAG
jgi:hypothetical protein